MKREALIRIMLVEDNQEYRSVLERVIKHTPNMELVSMAGTAERGISYLAANPKTINLILLDLQLPGASGLDAMASLLQHAPDAKIIVLTQSNREDDLFSAISQGAAGYLLKSSSVEDILNGIQAVAEGGSILHPEMAKYLLNHFKHKKGAPADTETLSEREIEVLNLIADGLVKKEIAAKLNLSFFTVAAHIRNIYEKLGVANAPQAIGVAYKNNILK
ncbi:MULTISPECIES: response regulator transcription factor [unclassified Lentimonas]|uniref:response regulator n=1 Tax=unclassified Lentimonas TaxID=2630993 RepID=UPI001327C7C2|nr:MULTISPECIES: response regulator transcription factor [unclassified Lentimonas]CAA6691518.1 Unannotated [Lentimonas sp. CC19]CAA6697361.1 Unannotated [Lentimonas sp. CC10]CAA7072360.1 Unannotated [Lentimonas sp. CC11]